MNIIEKLVNGNGDLAEAMRGVWVIAHRIGAKEVGEWAKKELEGYGPGEETPEYRRTESQATAEFTDGHNILTQTVRIGAIEGIENGEEWDRPTLKAGIIS